MILLSFEEGIVSYLAPRGKQSSGVARHDPYWLRLFSESLASPIVYLPLWFLPFVIFS
jgi:hypothetical protein